MQKILCRPAYRAKWRGLNLAMSELWKTGEAARVRVRLEAGLVSVRARTRFAYKIILPELAARQVGVD
jgi:hypothetical protein